MKKQYGYTLVELTICIMVGSAALSVALPAITSSIDKNRQINATNQLIGALTYTRGTAIMSRQIVSICSGPQQCLGDRNWKNALLIFTDTNGNGQLDSNDEVHQHLETQSGYSWNWSNFRNRSYLQYNADGTTTALNGTFTLCHKGLPLRQVVLNIAGRVRTQAPSANARCK